MDPHELDRLGGALGLAVHSEMMEAEEPSQEDPSLLIARNDNG
jgi:hypothetical protein